MVLPPPVGFYPPCVFLRQQRQRKQQEERAQRGMSRGDIQQRQQHYSAPDGVYPLWLFTTTETVLS